MFWREGTSIFAGNFFPQRLVGINQVNFVQCRVVPLNEMVVSIYWLSNCTKLKRACIYLLSDLQKMYWQFCKEISVPIKTKVVKWSKGFWVKWRMGLRLPHTRWIFSPWTSSISPFQTKKDGRMIYDGSSATYRLKTIFSVPLPIMILWRVRIISQV